MKNIHAKTCSPLSHRDVPASPGAEDPELEKLVREIIGRVADKWTMLALEVLAEKGRMRFTQLGELMGDVSQKMLTKTLRQMEADGLVVRTVYAVVPPRVEYELTGRGQSLGAAFCGVWLWAEEHREGILASRQAFEQSCAAPEETTTRVVRSSTRSSPPLSDEKF